MADLATDQVGSEVAPGRRPAGEGPARGREGGRQDDEEEKQALQESLDVAKMELQQNRAVRPRPEGPARTIAADHRGREEAQRRRPTGRGHDRRHDRDGAYKELYEEMLAQMGGEPATWTAKAKAPATAGWATAGKSTKTTRSRPASSPKNSDAHPEGQDPDVDEVQGTRRRSQRRPEARNRPTLDSVKQGYAEAIEAEQIPPGYRGSIQTPTSIRSARLGEKK